ncbi:MAG: threonine aldolase family protein [bacterium]
MIDLRSDTITKPSAEMRSAMASAVVGDDVLGDDPTVIELERRTAEILGKEAALYTPSGTMANQIAIRLHTNPGDEVICDETAHIYNYEAGAPAVLSGVLTKLLKGERGIFSAEDIEAVLRPPNVHFAPTSLVVLENTSNRGGGSVWPIENIRGIRDLCLVRGISLHLDGARLWNASAASGISEMEYASCFDTVAVCFSKGLGSPVGSALVGDAETIDRARRYRKMFGGGMRQAGIIAAGALYALENNRTRIVDDHQNAKLLAAGIAKLPGIVLDPDSVETNIVIFGIETMPAEELRLELERLGVRVLTTGAKSLRAVTSLMVTREDIENTVAAFDTICG